MNELNKVGGYKINIQKLVCISIPTVKYQKRNIKKTIPCKIAPKKKKPRNKPKDIKDLYAKKYLENQ